MAAWVGILVYLFFFFIRPQDWWKPLYLFPVDIVVMSCVFLLLVPSSQKILKVLSIPQTKFLILFLIAIILSCVFNGFTDEVLFYGIKYGQYIIIFIAIASAVDSFLKMKWLAIFMIILITFIGYQCMIQIETGVNLAGMGLYRDDSRARWVGVFDGSNTTGMALLITVPFIIEFFFGPWGILYKSFAIVSGYFVLNGIILTESRGAMLSLVLVIASYIAIKIKKKIYIVTLAVLMLIIISVASPGRMQVDDPEKSSRERIKLWDEALSLVRYRSTLIGVGKGHFTDFTSHMAHNAFLQVLSETGIIGAWMWLAFIYSNIKGSFTEILRKTKLNRLEVSLYRGFAFAFISLLYASIFLSADHELLYICGALLTSVMLINKLEFRLTRRDYKLIGAIQIGYIILIYIVIQVTKRVFF